jgi:hypothetical protein
VQESALSLVYDDAANTFSSSSSSSAWPRLPVYDSPWSQQNVALVYAHQLLDGVGAQTMRMLELYAVAKSLNIGYLHRPIRCVGHVDGRVHFRQSDCGDLPEADRRLVNKLRRLITLPSTVTEEHVNGWEHKYIPKLGWNTLAGLAEAALQSKRPLLISTEFATSILHNYSDMFLAVPEFQPKQPSVSRQLFLCNCAAVHVAQCFPWLFNSLKYAQMLLIKLITFSCSCGVEFIEADMHCLAAWTLGTFIQASYMLQIKCARHCLVLELQCDMF